MRTCRTLITLTKSGLVALFLCALSGCQTAPNDGVARSSALGDFMQSVTPYQKLGRFAGEHSGDVFTAAGTPFTLTGVASLVGHNPDQGDAGGMTVYIEGDGRAWLTSSIPSPDPSPRSYMMVQKALADTQPAVYLARPCQFQKNEDPGCNSTLWTSDRFSTAVLASFNQALDQFKRQWGVRYFRLVGYSGGGAVAMALAGQRQDIAQVVTIAGNVDPLAWIELHNLTPLESVVNPLDYAARLSNLPQRHFVGAKDKVVPPVLAKAFVQKIQARCADVVEMQSTHEDGWEALSAAELNRPINCQ